MTKYGCHNRPPMRASYPALNGKSLLLPFKHAAYKLVMVPHRNTTDCQYTKQNTTDDGCTGCCHQEKGAMA